MKVLFLSSYAHLALDMAAQHSSGGAELQVALLAKELVAQGHEAILLSAGSKKNDPIIQQGVKIRWGGRFDTGTFCDTVASLLPVFRILQEEKPDVVVVYGWTSWLYLLAKWRFLGRYRLIFVCALDSEIDGGFYKSHPWRGKLFKRGMKLCDARLAITKNQAALFHQQGMTCEVTRLLLQPSFSVDRVVDRSQKIIDLLWVARCNEAKQPMLFLDMAEQLPQTRCRMICSNYDQALWNSVKKRASSMPHVEFLEKVPYHEIQHHFDQAKIFVNTSFDEGVPNTFIHAGLGSTAIASLKVNPDNMFDHFQAGSCTNNDMNLFVEEVRQLLSDEMKLHHAQEETLRFVREWHDNKKNVEVFMRHLQPTASC